MNTMTLSTRSRARTLVMMGGVRWAGGMAAVAASSMFPAAAHALQSAGVLQPPAPEPSCEEKRALLKLKAAQAGTPATLESVPNPNWHPGSSREHKWLYREVPAQPGKVGGKSPDEIDGMDCAEIGALFAKSGGSGPRFINGMALTPDGQVVLGKEESSAPQPDLLGPSLVAPETHPDLKTGEWPTNTPQPLSKEQLFEVLGSNEKFPASPSEREKAIAAAQSALDSGASVVDALKAAMIAAYGASTTSEKPTPGSGGVQAGGIQVPIWNGVGVKAGMGKTETGEFASVVGATASGGVKAKDSWIDFDASNGTVGIAGLGLWWENEALVPGIRGSMSFDTPIGSAGVDCHSATGCEPSSEFGVSNGYGVQGELENIFVPRFGPPSAPTPRSTSPRYHGPREGLKYFYDRALPAGATATEGGEPSAAGKAGTRWFSRRHEGSASEK
jgi:hypothetical protein